MEGHTATLTEGLILKDHDVYLQTLDRHSQGVYLAKDAYESSMGKWPGVPVVFAENHPPMKQFETDPEAALAMVKGRVVGSVKEVHMETVGHPRLAATLNLMDDSEIEHLIKEGILSLSTGSWTKRTEDPELGEVVERVMPQHVLLFVEDATSGDLPGDLGTFILNKQPPGGGAVSDNDKGLLEKIRTLLKKEEKPTAMQGGDAVAAEVVQEAAVAVEEAIAAESFDTEAGKKLAEALSRIKELEAALAAAQGKTKELEEVAEVEMKAREDSEFESFKSKLPVGATHGDKEAEWRKLWDEHPHALVMKAMEFKADPEVGGQDGDAFSAMYGSPDATPTDNIGVYVPGEGWKDAGEVK